MRYLEKSNTRSKTSVTWRKCLGHIQGSSFFPRSPYELVWVLGYTGDRHLPHQRVQWRLQQWRVRHPIQNRVGTSYEGVSAKVVIEGDSSFCPAA